MSEPYSVDDILEELRQKRDPAAPSAPKPPSADAEATRLDLPIAAVARAVENDLSATRIMEPVRPEQPQPPQPERRGEAASAPQSAPKAPKAPEPAAKPAAKASEAPAAPAYNMDDSIDIEALFASTVGRRRGERPALEKLSAEPPPEAAKAPEPTLTLDFSEEAPKRPAFRIDEDFDGDFAPPAAQTSAPQPPAPPAPAAERAPQRPVIDRGEKMPFIVTIDDDKEDDLSALLPQEDDAASARERRAAEKEAARREKAEAKRQKAEARAEAKQQKLEARRQKKQAAAPEPQDEPSLSVGPQAVEYRTAEDVHTVRDELSYLYRSLRTRMVVVCLCFALSLYLSLCNLYPLPLLTVLWPESNITFYLIACLAPLLISALVSYPVLGNGVIALFTRRAGHDTPAALCVFAVLAHTIALLASGAFEVGRADLYPAVAILTLAANTLGKLMMVRRIERNFAVLTSEKELMGENMLRGGSLVERLTGLHDENDLALVYPARVGFAENFLAQSYSEDYSERMCRVAAPMMLLFSILSSLLCHFVFKQGALSGITVFCVMLCMSSALSETLVGNFPLWRASKALTKEGAFIAGYAVTDALGEMDAVAVDDCELYPAGAAVLHGIKAFRQDRIDSAIVDAASVLDAANGILRDVFLETIGGKSELLRPVTRLTYEQGGISAEVDGRRVLLGSRELLGDHGVPVVSAEVEAKYVKDGRDPLYLAEDGELTALFVLSYRVSRSVENRLRVLAKKGIQLVVRSADPNLSPERLERDFGFPAELTAFIPLSLHAEYRELCKPRERAEAGAMSVRKGRVRLRLLAALHTLRSSIRLGTLIQTAGLLLGYALTALLAFLGTVGSLGFGQVLLYQLFWLAAAIGFPALMRF